MENLVRIWNQDIDLSQGRVDAVSIARKRLCKRKLLDLKKNSRMSQSVNEGKN